MTDERLLEELVNFFLDSLQDDYAGTTDWVIQGDFDCDEFVQIVKDRRQKIVDKYWRGH